MLLDQGVVYPLVMNMQLSDFKKQKIVVLFLSANKNCGCLVVFCFGISIVYCVPLHLIMVMTPHVSLETEGK